MIVWVFVVLILTQSYTASLTSLLTLKQLQPTCTDINQLLKNKESVGYPKGSFVYDLLIEKGFDPSRIKPYTSPDECDQLLANGSAKGGISAAIDETPNLKLFLAKYCTKYTMVGPIFKTDGFAFVSLTVFWLRHVSLRELMVIIYKLCELFTNCYWIILYTLTFVLLHLY